MKSIMKSERLLKGIVILLPIAFILVVVFAVSGTAKKQPATPSSVSRSTADSKNMPVTAEQAQVNEQTAEWLATSSERFDTPAQASASLNSKQKGMKKQIPLLSRVPNDSGLGTPTGIYVANEQHVQQVCADPATMGQADVVRINYPNGIFVTAGFKTDEEPRDYDSLVSIQNAPDNAEHTGLLHVVTVHGFKGMGSDPGYDYVPSMDRKNIRGAFLEWTDDNARYCIRAPIKDQTIPLSTLMGIAESMYKN